MAHELIADRKCSKQMIGVLLADDHPAFRAGIRAMLETGGIKVVGEAATGREAIEAARRLQPDLVLMDVEMPDMDGLTATAKIKCELPTISIIVLTAFDSAEYLRHAVVAGAAGYILKDRPDEVLIPAIHLVLEGESIIEHHILADLIREVAAEHVMHQDSSVAALRNLTAREHEVLRLITEGSSNREIAAALAYSESTVKNVVRSIVGKLGVSDRTQAAVTAARGGIRQG